MHSSKSSFFRWLQGARQQVGRQLQAEMDRESMAPELTLRPRILEDVYTTVRQG